MKSFTIGKKIAGTSGALIALAALLGIVSLFSVNRIYNCGRQVFDISLPMMRDLQTATVAAKEQKIAKLTHIASASPQQMAKAEATISQRESEFQESLVKLATDTPDVTARQLVEDWKTGHQQLLSVWSKILPFSRANKNEEAVRMWTEQGVPAANATAQATSRLDQAINSETNQNAKASLASTDSARLWCWFVLITSVMTGSLLSFFVISSISRTLKAAVLELGQGADRVASAATEIAASSQSVAQGTSEQAASLEETSASSEEMTSMTRKNADNSQQCAQLMLQVDSRVNVANQTLAQMVNSMNEINSSSNKISKIIKVIDEIAFQTNILALNAAVEAARAGEAGMGFAVVADEVRTLAQRSAQAAKDTAALIEESISRSSEGSAKLTQVSDAISTITESTNQVKTLVDEVNLGSQEQARGVEQIAKAIAQIERVTQQAASSSEEAASASEELTAQVGGIRTIISQLESLVDHAHPATSKSVRSGRNKKQTTKPVSMSRNLNALKAAISAKTPLNKTALTSRPAYTSTGKPEKNPIPMDDDFKEF